MEKWRLLKLGEVDAYTSNILPEALGIAKSRGIIDNTLVLFSSLPYVWVGRKTGLSQVNVSFCKEKGIPIARNIHSGGASLMGNQSICLLVLDKGSFSEGDIAYRLFLKGIIKACQKIGLLAYHKSNSNDILVGERKITGTAQLSLGDALFFWGSILLDFDYGLAKEVLIIPDSKFKDKKAKSITEWVTSLKRELGRDVSFEEAEAALEQGFKDTLQVEFNVLDSFTEVEEQIIEGLQAKYQSDTWLKYGKWSPVKDYWRPK